MNIQYINDTYYWPICYTEIIVVITNGGIIQRDLHSNIIRFHILKFSIRWVKPESYSRVFVFRIISTVISTSPHEPSACMWRCHYYNFVLVHLILLYSTLLILVANYPCQQNLIPFYSPLWYDLVLIIITLPGRQAWKEKVSLVIFPACYKFCLVRGN